MCELLIHTATKYFGQSTTMAQYGVSPSPKQRFLDQSLLDFSMEDRIGCDKLSSHKVNMMISQLGSWKETVQLPAVLTKWYRTRLREARMSWEEFVLPESMKDVRFFGVQNNTGPPGGGVLTASWLMAGIWPLEFHSPGHKYLTGFIILRWNRT